MARNHVKYSDQYVIINEIIKDIFYLLVLFELGVVWPSQHYYGHVRPVSKPTHSFPRQAQSSKWLITSTLCT